MSPEEYMLVLNENWFVDLLHIVFDRLIESMLNVHLNHIYPESHF
jgi:hypothetical protein